MKCRREIVREKTEELIEARRKISNQYHLMMELKAGAKGGVFLAYLMGSWDWIWAAYRLRRVSQQALRRFEICYEDEMRKYAKARETLGRQMIEHATR